MPEIKCHMGHTQHVSTTDWVAALTLDQLRFARDAMDEKIKAAEAQQSESSGVCAAAVFAKPTTAKTNTKKLPTICFASSRASLWKRRRTT